MEISACFHGSFGGISYRNVKYRTSLCAGRRNFHSYTRERTRFILRCLHEKDRTEDQNPSLEDEFRDIVQTSMQNSGNESQQSDRRIMDGIVDTGVKEIEGIANEVKDELNDLQRLVEENADRFIEEETRQVLASYDQKQKELLGNVEKDRQVISMEIERITELAKGVEGRSRLDRRKTLREKAYFVMCSIFAVSALYFAWKGFVDSDSAALTNAGVDAAVAAACTYFYSKESAKK